MPQLFLDIDRDKAEALGVPVAEIFSVLQASLGSSYVNDFNLFGKVYRVILQAEARHRNTVEDIGRLHVRNAAGDMIPLRALVADVETILGPLSISRYNQAQAAALSGSNGAGFSTGEAVRALEAVAGRVLPEGYAIDGFRPGRCRGCFHYRFEPRPFPGKSRLHGTANPCGPSNPSACAARRSRAPGFQG